MTEAITVAIGVPDDCQSGNLQRMPSEIVHGLGRREKCHENLLSLHAYLQISQDQFGR